METELTKEPVLQPHAAHTYWQQNPQMKKPLGGELNDRTKSKSMLSVNTFVSMYSTIFTLYLLQVVLFFAARMN